MKAAILSLLECFLVLLGCTQCASDNPEAAKPQTATAGKHGESARMVSLPTNLSEQETECVGPVGDVLKEAGFQPAREAGAAYQLEIHVTGSTAAAARGPTAIEPGAPATGRKQLSFSMPGGSLHSVVSVVLHKGSRTVAVAEGRFEGPRTSHTPDQIMQSALARCLQQLSAQLARVNELGTTQSVAPE